MSSESIGTVPGPGNFEQPILEIADPQSFGVVRNAIEKAFSLPKVAEFLQSVSRCGVRIRDFDSVLGKALLGDTTTSEYRKLGNADQGQIRELYLATLERVTPDLRAKFFKLYSYY